MWHWNSWWAPAPGDPPAVDDPKVWQSPWSIEQALALQARSWEAYLAATHSVWSAALTAWPIAMPNFPQLPVADTSGEKSATVHRLPPPPRKRPAARRARSRSTQA